MIKEMKLKIILILFLFLGMPFLSFASLSRIFFVAREFDLHQRQEINALLIQSTPSLNFYVDEAWWTGQGAEEQSRIRTALNALDQEFRTNIHPTLTSIFGFEARPGIDGDLRITILIHPMIREIGGYFSSSDGFPRIQAPRSNQREMIYLNAQHIRSERMRDILAHEFLHLITFNQKDIIHRVSEEVWLNDVRAEVASTLLGYNDVLRNSSLEERLRIFASTPTDSLTEWQERLADYGVVNLFAHYLVDHYGIRVLVDSLRSREVGIASINYALRKNGFQEDFAQVFTNFKIAVLVNDCGLGPRFCFLNPHLRDFRITPRLNFLPQLGDSVLQLVDNTTYWAGNWHRVIGGQRILTLEFDGDDRVSFRVPYLLCTIQGNCLLNFLDLDRNQQGRTTIIGFNQKYASLTIIPSIQSKFAGFNGIESRYSFNWRVSTTEKTEAEKEAELRQQLLTQIEFLRAEIARLEAKIQAALIARISCQRIEANLSFGMRNSAQVRCLQEFLIAQGQEIYPNGLVTGNFLSSTQAAVRRFQLKNVPGTIGTGFVGPRTRNKINQLLSR